MLYLVRCFDPYMYQASLHYSRSELHKGQMYRARRDPIDRVRSGLLYRKPVRS